MAGGTTISSSIDISAPAEKVWSLITDLPRMAEWSPENVGGQWVGGATGPAPGVRFMGKNKNGRRFWPGLVVINEAVAPERLSFTVKVGPLNGASWAYDIEATGAGCTVTETWTDTVTPGLMLLGRFLTGVADRRAFTKTSIETTLANLKGTAETTA